MELYVIQHEDGWFVSKRGSKSSYTQLLQDARVFARRSIAEHERCPGNEHVYPVRDLLWPVEP